MGLPSVLRDEQATDVNRVFEADVENTIKVIYRRGNPVSFGKPALTSPSFAMAAGLAEHRARRTWERTQPFCLDESTFNTLCAHIKHNGFFGASAYYLNHAANAEYSKSAVNGGVLDIPALFIGGRYDGVCDTAVSNLSSPMRKYCRKLTECSIEAGHWVGLERPQETNAAIARWLVSALPTSWPGYWTNPLVSNAP